MSVHDNQPQNSQEVHVVIDSVRLSKVERRKVVVLADDESKLYLPIWVGPIQGDIIVSELRHIPHPDCSVLVEHLCTQGNPLRMCISDLVDDVYYATLTVFKDGRQTSLALAPNDAICAAIRLGLPIFVNQAVMQAAASSPPTHNLILKAHSVVERVLEKLGIY